ncbi:MAG: cytochrome b/b6 domain-containing protein [Bdellovibrionales bacterium]
MRSQKVYDFPTRVFHALFAATILVGLTIAKTVDDESLVFSYHMLLGMTASFLVLFRVAWGFWGSTHARFSGLALQPAGVLQYFREILQNRKSQWVGHNPATSWMTLLMILLVLGLGTTGFLMTSGQETEIIEEIHEIFANVFLALIVFHLLGVILHQVRYQDGLVMSMIDGKKSNIPADKTIKSESKPIGWALLSATVLWLLLLVNSFDTSSRRLTLGGLELQLGEVEEEH